MVAESPRESPETLRRDLLAARERALRVTADIGGDRLLGPKIRIVNPPLWEIGHVSWFQERWCLRWRPDGTLGDSILPGADALYDSSAVAHDTRWGLPLPDLAATRRYGEAVMERVLARHGKEPDNADLAYFIRLSTFHEDMHAEAFLYTRQTLGYEGFDFSLKPCVPGEVDIPAQEYALGSKPGGGFVFDNEKWAHPVSVEAFRIARSPVSNAEYLAYVGAGGPAPRYWKKQSGGWAERRFERWIPLDLAMPVRHVSWDEAQAYCAWAKRRLPTEAEWECASALIEFGQVWEWTASAFEPYPGFSPDPYADYSQPWFGTHKVLRGASFFTPERLRSARYRNFYTPDRADVFCGFRTCSIV